MTTVTNKNGVEFDIDDIITDLNGKMDVDGVNSTCPTLLSRTANNLGGVCEIWSDGYCVQTGVTGIIADYGTATVSLSQAYDDTTYIIMTTASMPNTGDDGQWNDNAVTRWATKTTSSFQIYNRGAADNGRYVYWRTEGYIR